MEGRFIPMNNTKNLDNVRDLKDEHVAARNTWMMLKLRQLLAMALLIVGAGFMPAGSGTAQAQTVKATKRTVKAAPTQDRGLKWCKGNQQDNACPDLRVKIHFHPSSKAVRAIDVSNRNQLRTVGVAIYFCDWSLANCEHKFKAEVPPEGTETIETNSQYLFGPKKMVALFRSKDEELTVDQQTLASVEQGPGTGARLTNVYIRNLTDDTIKVTYTRTTQSHNGEIKTRTITLPPRERMGIGYNCNTSFGTDHCSVYITTRIDSATRQ